MRLYGSAMGDGMSLGVAPPPGPSSSTNGHGASPSISHASSPSLSHPLPSTSHPNSLSHNHSSSISLPHGPSPLGNGSRGPSRAGSISSLTPSVGWGIVNAAGVAFTSGSGAFTPGSGSITGRLPVSSSPQKHVRGMSTLSTGSFNGASSLAGPSSLNGSSPLHGLSSSSNGLPNGAPRGWTSTASSPILPPATPHNNLSHTGSRDYIPSHNRPVRKKSSAGSLTGGSIKSARSGRSLGMSLSRKESASSGVGLGGVGSSRVDDNYAHGRDRKSVV